MVIQASMRPEGYLKGFQVACFNKRSVMEKFNTGMIKPFFMVPIGLFIYIEKRSVPDWFW